MTPPRQARIKESASDGAVGSLSHVSDKSRAGARKLAFASFVRKALDGARATRAWNGSEVARRTGVSRQTINRWVRGDWASDPEPERVAAFCGGLGLAPSAAFGILGWDRSAPDRPAPAPTAALDPDIEALLRRLADPRVSDAEKFHIRETVRYLAHRPPLEIGRSTRRAPTRRGEDTG